MDFQDIVMDEFRTKDIDCLNEGWFPITPLLAYTTFKKNIFDKLNKNKILQAFKKIGSGQVGREIKGAALVAKEKIRHDVGVSGDKPDSSVYKLTPEQVVVLADITNKYGKKILNDIYLFRKNILAPYQVIKRLVKENKQVSFKDKHGLSYEEYKSALESGRRKILRRKDYFDRTKEKTNKTNDLSNVVDDIEEAIKNFNNKKGELSDSILNKIYQELEVGEDELEGYTLAELKVFTDELARNYKKIEAFLTSDGESDVPEEILATIERNIEIRGGGEMEDAKKAMGELKSKKLKRGNVNVALAKYMLRKEIRSQIKEADSNAFKKMYIELLQSLSDKLKNRKKDYVQNIIGEKLAVEFNDKEKKVWGKLLTTKSDFSGNLEDYYQKISDTAEKEVHHIHKPEELEKAQQEIENEIKRFERKLAKTLSPEDLAKLKKYRLINNLITVKEMYSPEKLFKTEIDVKSNEQENEVSGEEENADEKKDGEEENYVSESEFIRRLEELTTMEFDTINELNNAKKQLDKLVSKMKEQGDDEIVKKYENVIQQMKARRTTEKKEIAGNKYLYGEVIDIDMVESFARNMLKKKYDSVDEMKQDKIIFEKMMEKYKKEDPEAERNLKEIDFLLGQVDRKFEGNLGRFFGED